MKYQYYIIVILLSITFINCKHNETSANNYPKEIRLTYQVVPEDPERGWYYVEWKDTLGLAEGYLDADFLKRPKEIWCVITNKKNDTLGYYRGRSMAQTFADFISTDTIVTLNFMTGMNLFSDKSFKTETEWGNHIKQNRLPIKYEPIEINIQRDLRKEFEVVLKEK